MNESKHPRAVIGLILLAVLCTMALGLQEQRSAPLAAYSPVSPVDAGPRTLQRFDARAFWLEPWPWVVVGLVGFGLLAWGFLRRVRRMERD